MDSIFKNDNTHDIQLKEIKVEIKIAVIAKKNPDIIQHQSREMTLPIALQMIF